MPRPKTACRRCAESKITCKDAAPCLNCIEKGAGCELAMNDKPCRTDRRWFNLISGGPFPKHRRKTPACEPCQKRKIRCVGASSPCQTCKKRGYQQECIFLNNPPDEFTNGLTKKRVQESRCAPHPFAVTSFPVRKKSPTSKTEVVDDVDEMKSPNLLPASEEMLCETEETLDLCLGPAREARDDYDISQGFQLIPDILCLADESGYGVMPGADLLSICESQYGPIQGPWPTALVYAALVSSKAAYIESILELLRVTMCEHLQHEQFKDTSMGHLTTIALALRCEILIPCDKLEVAGQDTCDVVYGNVPYRIATLQRLLLNSDSTKSSAPWSIEVCLSNCGSKVCIVGSLHSLHSLVALIRHSPFAT